MQTIYSWLKQRLNFIYKFFLFILTALIVLYFFPREGKFPYEFQKGKPWQHKTYFAPFDFPIYKTQEELGAEQDSLLLDFRPFYKYNIEKQNEMLQAFSAQFELQWLRSFNKDTLKDYPKIKHRFSELQLHFFKDTCYSFLYHLLNTVYNKGMLDKSSIENQDIDNYSELITVRNNYAEYKSVESIYSPKSAYEKLLLEVDKFLKSNDIRMFYFADEFIRQLSLNSFIEANLIFDEYKTNKTKENLLTSISLTRGMVQEGERIIIQGDIVNDDNFKLLESLRIEYKKRVGATNYFLILIGQIILVFILMFILFLFMYNFRREVLGSNKKTTFILLLVILATGLAGLVTRYNLTNIYILPLAIVPILVLTFFDSRLALFIHFISILLVGFYAPNGFEFIFLSFVSGIMAIFSLKNLYQRSKIFLTATLVILIYGVTYFGIYIIQEGNIQKIIWQNFIWFVFNGLLILVSIPLIYIFEKMFGFLSDATLLELSDTNQPLLRKLAEEAPGTFQHSLQVANLAEEAAISIEGNPLLIRAGALYHDIGKIDKSEYFIENQISGYNPHEDIDFIKSAELIVQHIPEGVKIAKKYKLPKQIIDFITTHQGTAKVHYFYRLFKNKYPDADVDISKFTYPGPKPYSKETAILMMADAVEAASRSLKNPSANNIDELVDKIIDNQIQEKQFDDAAITFKDIITVKNVFKKKLLNIYHVRLQYPDEAKS